MRRIPLAAAIVAGGSALLLAPQDAVPPLDDLLARAATSYIGEYQEKFSGVVSRLLTLFTSPLPDTLDQARRIAQEAARYNSAIARTTNTPTLALTFLERSHQARSTFTIDGTKTFNDVRTTVLRFTETGLPRVITTVDNAAASGRFWIEPAMGRAVRTELQLDSAGASTYCHATYSHFRTFNVDINTIIKAP